MDGTANAPARCIAKEELDITRSDLETKEADSLNVKRPQKLTNLLWDIFIRFESSLEPMIAILLLVLPKIKRTSLQNESSPHDFSENPAPGARTILKPSILRYSN